MTVRDELYEYINENFLYLQPDLELTDEDRFLELGVIDSTGVVELVGEVEERYGITVERHTGEWVDGLWATDPDACCGMRKVRPLERVLEGVDAWITGLRRDQSPTRAGTPKLAADEGHPGKLKCAPLADWSEKDVWRYIADHDVPYHPLHDRGYESIGCTHCTVAGGGRDGRWAGTDKIECGLHLPGN